MITRNMVIAAGVVTLAIFANLDDNVRKDEVELDAQDWVCITDLECQIEEDSRRRGEKCVRVQEHMFCYPVDRR